MHDVERCARDRRRGDHFARRLDAGARLDAASAPDVHVDRDAMRRGDSERPNHFQSCRARRIREAHADAECARLETAFQPRCQLCELFVADRIVGFRPRSGHDGAGRHRLSENRHTRARVADGRAKVHERAAGALLDECRDVHHADFELERRRHTVQRFQTVVLGVLSM